MEATADQGIIARWHNRDRDLPLSLSKQNESKAFAWLEQLLEWQRDVKDPTEFLETVKTDLFGEEVFVFTPDGDVKALPKGATPVDFAYAIHTSVGTLSF